jgi:hypothetical protein
VRERRLRGGARVVWWVRAAAAAAAVAPPLAPPHLVKGADGAVLVAREVEAAERVAKELDELELGRDVLARLCVEVCVVFGR